MVLHILRALFVLLMAAAGWFFFVADPVQPRSGDALRERLRAAQIFVLPSHTEGQPIGIIEAMASGLAVVATRVGDVPEGAAELVTAETDRSIEQGLAWLAKQQNANGSTKKLARSKANWVRSKLN